MDLWGKERGLSLEEATADRRLCIATLRLCHPSPCSAADTNPLLDVYTAFYTDEVPDGYTKVDSDCVSNMHVQAHADAIPNAHADK